MPSQNKIINSIGDEAQNLALGSAPNTMTHKANCREESEKQAQGVAQSLCPCLVCARSWVPSPATQKQNKKPKSQDDRRAEGLLRCTQALTQQKPELVAIPVPELWGTGRPCGGCPALLCSAPLSPAFCSTGWPGRHRNALWLKQVRVLWKPLPKNCV